MRDLPSSLTTLMASDSCTWITCVEMQFASGTIYRALWSEDVSFDSVTYTHDIGSFDELKFGTQSTRSRFVLSLQNTADVDDGAALPWTTTTSSEALNGTPVVFRFVEESLLADTDAVILDEGWYVSGYEIDAPFIRFGLGSPHDALAIEVPRLPVGSKQCGWAANSYKQGPCTSTSPLKTCGGTLADCMKRNDPKKPLPFGPSFPFMSRQSRGRR